MEELIKIEEHDGKRAVNARQLHEFLQNKRKFTDWIKQRIDQYGFIENVDYEVFHNFVKNPSDGGEVFTKIGENPKGGRPQTEYALSLDMAKELSMVENNERGRMARRYFIECERIAKDKLLQENSKGDIVSRTQAFQIMIDTLGSIVKMYQSYSDTLNLSLEMRKSLFHPLFEQLCEFTRPNSLTSFRKGIEYFEGMKVVSEALNTIYSAMAKK